MRSAVCRCHLFQRLDRLHSRIHADSPGWRLQRTVRCLHYTVLHALNSGAKPLKHRALGAMRAALLACLFLLLLAAAKPLSACECITPDPKTGFKHASSVFLGEVVTASRGQITFNVIETFKGRTADVITVDGRGSCGYSVKYVGDQYLIWARRGDDGTLYIGFCALSHPVKQDDWTLRTLRRRAWWWRSPISSLRWLEWAHRVQRALIGDVIHRSYATGATALHSDDARGWIPKWLPASATRVRIQYNLRTGERWISFELPAADRPGLVSLFRPVPAGRVLRIPPAPRPRYWFGSLGAAGWGRGRPADRDAFERDGVVLVVPKQSTRVYAYVTH